jgi:hypothetical protein
MSINRVIVVLPVLAGLVLTGTAVARMMPSQSVRDSVYQTCAHNGVSFNKQGHANCGLHKGWTDQGTTEESTEGSEPGDQGDTQPSGDTGTRHGASAKGHGHAHEHGHHVQTAHTHGSHGHTHGTDTHGHSGHGSGHGKGHSKH